MQFFLPLLALLVSIANAAAVPEVIDETSPGPKYFDIKDNPEYANMTETDTDPATGGALLGISKSPRTHPSL
jgi:hypothetical protein